MYCLAHQKNKSDHILTHHNMLRKYSPNFLSQGGCQVAGNGELKCDDTTLSIFGHRLGISLAKLSSLCSAWDEPKTATCESLRMAMQLTSQKVHILAQIAVPGGVSGSLLIWSSATKLGTWKPVPSTPAAKRSHSPRQPAMMSVVYSTLCIF